MANKFTQNFQNDYEIDVKGTTDVANAADASWKRLAAGITQVTPNSNDTVDNTEYYDGGGFGSADVTAKRLSLAFSGYRLQGNEAQDYVASLESAIGDDCKTLFKWTKTDGSVLTGSVTVSNVVTSGGTPSAKETFSFTVTFNGKPTYTKASN